MGIICGIYKITSPSKKIYIGQSIDIERRFRGYKRLKCAAQRRLCRSLTKHGADKHKFEIVHLCDSEELNTLEKYYINLFQTFNSKHGLNLQFGGHGTHCAETRLKMSIARRKQIPPMTGRKHSKETLLKMSISRRKVKISAETCAKISASKIGKPAWNKGKKSTKPFKLRERDSKELFICLKQKNGARSHQVRFTDL